MGRSGILVFSLSSQGLKEEIPEAYKDVDDVVDVTVASGISGESGPAAAAAGRQGLSGDDQGSRAGSGPSVTRRPARKRTP